MAYTFKYGDRPLEGYTIQRGIGRGGFGEVYFAVSDGGREVALKYLRDNSDIELRGVSQCMNLKSPHLVTIFDVKKSADGEYFIIMEHISGPSLQELLVAEPNGLGVEKTAFLLREIGSGLAYLHDRGIVHRDMKPANIFYEDGHVKIGDYGLSKFISISRHSAQTTSVGTVHYMAPEVGGGNYHRGIDIYALGVMLYEMLLGRVPFEGSSMGEVLMKHLTEQPEVEGLAKPFGKVIRKALEKDPKDRYQNVNEMIDDMLEVGDIQKSLAGFNPSTIAATPRSPAAGGAPTPVPSPNPPRGAVAPAAFDAWAPERGAGKIPKRIEDRINRISRKVARKMDRLAGKRPRRFASPREMVAAIPRSTGAGFRRIFVAFLMVVGVAVGVGVIIGVSTERPEIGASTGMMIVAMVAGMRLTGRVTRWLDKDAEPNWVQGFVFMACSAPFMAMASIPMVANEFGPPGFALMIGMLIFAFFTDWDKRVECGSRGELSFWDAAWLAFCGAIVCAIVAGIFEARGEDRFALMGAGVGGAVAILTQALAWMLRPIAPLAGPSGGATARREEAVPPPPPPTPAVTGFETPDARDIPFAIPVEPGTPAHGLASTVPVPRMRSGIERGFFSVVAFMMLFGAVMAVLWASLVEMHGEELMLAIVTAGGCFSLLLFSAQKLTHRKRRGFWRETLCPFLIAAMMTGLCANIAYLGVFEPLEGSEEFAGPVVGIVFSSLLLLALLVSRLRGSARVIIRTMPASSEPFIKSDGIPNPDWAENATKERLPPWTEDEFETLIERPNLSDEQVAATLPRRSVGAVGAVRAGLHAFHLGQNDSMLSQLMRRRLGDVSRRVRCPRCEAWVGRPGDPGWGTASHAPTSS